MKRGSAESIAFDKIQDCEFGPAYRDCLVEDRLEHRLQFAGRTGDDLQNLRGRRLLLQGFGEIVGARLHLVEQPHVLNRDHRLVGKGGDQLDLPFRKWPHGGPLQIDHTDRCSFAQHRNTEHCVDAADLCRPAKGVLRIGQDVGNLNDLAFQKRPSDYRSASEWNRMSGHVGLVLGCVAVLGNLPVDAILLAIDGSHIGLAQPRHRFDQRVEHVLQIEGRAADDLEHVGGCGLLLQRFAQLVEQARVLDGNHGLVREILSPARSACR